MRFFSFVHKDSPWNVDLFIIILLNGRLSYSFFVSIKKFCSIITYPSMELNGESSFPPVKKIETQLTNEISNEILCVHVNAKYLVIE